MPDDGQWSILWYVKNARPQTDTHRLHEMTFNGSSVSQNTEFSKRNRQIRDQIPR